ncbi:NUDIX hydrolase domain-like protein [Scleroderma yunnanense]
MMSISMRWAQISTTQTAGYSKCRRQIIYTSSFALHLLPVLRKSLSNYPLPRLSGAITRMPMRPKITSTIPLGSSDARWIGLKKINYTDEDGKQRIWECAERKTRGKSGIDGVCVVLAPTPSIDAGLSHYLAVSILAILRSRTNAFPLSTVVVEQYRPPIDKIVVELPAGLIDAQETAEQAAIRELKEETGYKAERIMDSSPVIVSDPGMTNANMKLVVVSVLLDNKLETPPSKPDDGEHIEKRVIPLDKLKAALKEYDEKVRN